MPILTARVLGSRRALVPDFHVPLPPEYSGGGGDVRLRDLIACIVRWEVLEFGARQEERRLARVLSREDIEPGEAQGKVDPGGREPSPATDEVQAVGVAWQAFEDGLYLVFLDDVEQRDLEAVVTVGPESRVLFVRLVMLAGA